MLEFIIEDAQPFYILKSNSFQSFVQSLNPSYNLPTQEKIDEMLEYNYQNVQNLLIEIMERESKYISLTSDFWTSRGKHGYLGITCHWISNEYQPQEALLSLVHIPYPHTSEVISKKLQEIIFSWKLEEKVICITTDSGSNFIKAVKLLQRVFFDIKRVSCNAHTLNLVVRKSLKINIDIQKFILRVKRLIKFFSSPKRCEILEKEQENLNYPKIYKIINDVSTRWNSTYYSWQRLILLKDAITHLPSRYRADQNKEVRKEANKLERILLSEPEWTLMSDLVIVLKDFEEITRKLSGATYITFSLIYPSIYKLIKNLQEMLPESTHLSINNEFEDSSEQLQLDDQEDVFNIQDILEDEEVDEISILDSNTRKKINISRPIETDGLKNLIIEALLIYSKKYWDAPSNLSMVATILDPRLKKLSFFEKEDIRTTIFNLREEYELSRRNNSNNLQNETCEVEEDSESLIDLTNNNVLGSSIFSQILPADDENNNESDEITCYLSTKVRNDINPLDWWRDNEKDFPTLSLLAKKFFCIPATSTPSERLFSDVGNCITSKRTNLKPDRVGKMMFLKRNMKFIL